MAPVILSFCCLYFLKNPCLLSFYMFFDFIKIVISWHLKKAGKICKAPRTKMVVKRGSIRIVPVGPVGIGIATLCSLLSMLDLQEMSLKKNPVPEKSSKLHPSCCMLGPNLKHIFFKSCSYLAEVRSETNNSHCGQVHSIDSLKIVCTL